MFIKLFKIRCVFPLQLISVWTCYISSAKQPHVVVATELDSKSLVKNMSKMLKVFLNHSNLTIHSSLFRIMKIQNQKSSQSLVSSKTLGTKQILNEMYGVCTWFDSVHYRNPLYNVPDKHCHCFTLPGDKKLSALRLLFCIAWESHLSETSTHQGTQYASLWNTFQPSRNSIQKSSILGPSAPSSIATSLLEEGPIYIVAP